MNIETYFKRFKSAIVALSGGADSAVVLQLATNFLGKGNVVAATCVNLNMFTYEINLAYKIASLLDVSWKPFYSKLAKNLFNSDSEKCFYCKNNIMEELIKIKKELDMDVIFDGTNFDDLNDFRPGLKALKMYDIKSPLLENGLGKDFVKEAIKKSILSKIDFHTQSCIATRIKANGANHKIMRKIEIAEDRLRNNFPDIRVRYFGDYLKVEFKGFENSKIDNQQEITKVLSEVFCNKKIIF
ncbi:conserved hypothetical protein [Deferribacter desulfuricans SSM1]|uniref:NAD/GMP synthase domain-containing protein n=1 Tax=Deferribacter desulfuricans (strain DSM 14783 / JCM 11476 / NBRC 101012 / SSM1) TaxID=639282 RepID=D3P8Q3_DEFDS|nr:hypothetical protein [Deferribacter desulfuricans]BAI81093.1 conserved hypothetical protein [Deferribacter desulfuricans SSM1]